METGNYGHWDISAVGEFDPAEWFGFIYEIHERSTGKSYIGKKFFKFKRKKTKSDKSRTKPSDWMDYTSSSELVSDLIKEEGKEAFDFRILRLCSGRCELTYAEMEEQFGRNVLRARLPNGERAFFNKTIAYKNFAGVEKQTEETRRKMSEHSRWKGGAPKPEHRDDGVRVFTEEHKRKLSEAHIGHVPWNKGIQTGVGGWKGERPQEYCEAISAAHKAKGIEPKTCRLPRNKPVELAGQSL